MSTFVLTPTEKKVHSLLITGSSTAKIAAHLSVQPSTIKFHITRIYRKKGVSSRSQLLALARSDLLSLNTSELTAKSLISSMDITYDPKYDIIIARNHNQILLFKTQRQFQLFMRINSKAFKKALAFKRCHEYTVTIIKGTKYA